MDTSAPGVLYVVATPIGHRADLSPRAREVLERVDVLAAEDTRVTARLVSPAGRWLSLHEHNERDRVAILLEHLAAGRDVALVSDAGTPLVSDPGYRLVAAAHEAGFRVSPVPGPCAAIAALSVCGLATDRFVFEGFLPSRRGARRARLEVLADEPRTMVFFEAARRLQDALDDMADIFGAGREAALARELTKRFETVRRASLGALAVWVGEDAEQRRGEVVIAVAGCPGEDVDHRDEVDRALRVLLEELPTRQAVDLVSRLLDAPRNLVYQRALALEKVR